MRCPFCRHPDSRVADSREVGEGEAIRRRRHCPACGKRFTTLEAASLSVRKRSGVLEPFDRAKVVRGVRRACQGRPVAEDALALLAQQVEESVREGASAEVSAHQVGLAILEPLAALDEVAYLRFASVYRGFSSLADFEAAIAALRGTGSAAVTEATHDASGTGASTSDATSPAATPPTATPATATPATATPATATPATATPPTATPPAAIPASATPPAAVPLPGGRRAPDLRPVG